ncbi:dihydroneopterin triphosphate pyrophosphohydolase type 2 [Klebsiella pneumoniae subsp. ozaenae]|uniref:Dihydroneopterin triphosphate pyrophosphohydolase type 2 n=1 Tax=Klebsiella pneumoniae subsp. ozaenae TaxID=574 RepID=A0A378BGI6_KLEPO|nr:dihydroneopterin triphosphate pyrophosphohydolase type 2 [Klebsiella pneumoniae subsp. ozaenae]
MSFKLPVSVLVVIYAEDTKRVLMLQRRDDSRVLAVGHRQPGSWRDRAAGRRA